MSNWPTILVASLISALAAITAIWVKERIDRRTRLEDRRSAAYQRLAAASEVIAMRSSVYNSLRGIRYSLGLTLNNLTKFMLVMFLQAFRPLRVQDGLLRTLVD